MARVLETIETHLHAVDLIKTRVSRINRALERLSDMMNPLMCISEL